MSQTIISGLNGLKDLLSEKFLLVCDSSFPFLSIRTFFDTIGVPHETFSDFQPNPLYENVVDGVRKYKNTECRMIVVVGGGSAIDVAKCIKLFSTMDPEVNYLKQTPEDNHITLIAIPTTAGTGSESTRHAVIYYQGEKQSISHTSIVPDYAFLDASLLSTLPLYQKKCTMLDALCHGIESWWSVNSTEESIGYAERAISGISDHWQDYIEHNDADAAADILLAANYAGRAINITATTAAHAMSYKLTSLYHLPHGHSVALCLPHVWRFILEHPDRCIDARGSEYLAKVLDDIGRRMSLTQFTGLMDRLGMGFSGQPNLPDDLVTLTRTVNPVRLKNYPVKLTEDDLYSLYKDIIQ